MPLPAGRSPGWAGTPRAWVPRPSRRSAYAQGMMPLPAGRSLGLARAPRARVPRPSGHSAGIKQRGWEGAISRPAWQGHGWAEAPPVWVPRPPHRSAGAEQRGGEGTMPPLPGKARDGLRHRVRVCHGPCAAWLTQSGKGAGRDVSPGSPRRAKPGTGRDTACWVHGPCAALLMQSSKRGGARCPSQPGEARDGQGHHFHGCHCPQVAQLSRSSGGGGGEIANPDSRCRSPPGEAMDWPGCPGPKCESVTACRCSREGRAQCRSPPGEARAGPGRHMLGGHGPRAVRLTQPRNSEDSAEEGRAHCSSPRGKARDEPGHRVRWCRCRRSAWLTQSSR